MLSCSDLSVQIGKSGPKILDGITAKFPARSLNALVGPSGCGKTTLIKAFLGLIEASGEQKIGTSRSTSQDNRLGFVPQFSVAHENLTVFESLHYTYRLTCSDRGSEQARIERVLELVSLAEHSDKLVSSLSGGQLRRLSLAMELVSEPACLICDEVTSGLDPLSEDQIIALLRKLVEENQKTFLCTIHNLAKLPDFDTITVLYQGSLVFQGSYPELLNWFELDDPLNLYRALAEHPLEIWTQHWSERNKPERMEQKDDMDASPQDIANESPSWSSQLRTLLDRRYKLLWRDKGYLWLLLSLTFGFPCVVVIFALGGLPEIQGLSLEPVGSLAQQLQDDLSYRISAMETATLVTGLIMFQAVLLTLMGSNNGAREIAAERTIYEKERLGGLSPVAYATSKLLFTGSIALFQGLWMGLFVKIVCEFPGPYFAQLGIMALCCIAMTFFCLSLSALLLSAERASLLSVYIVGFQLPLSGVVLALPDAVVWLFRPFINAYWAWAGYFGSMKDFMVYDAYRVSNATWLPEFSTAAAVLLLHCVLSMLLVFYGCFRKQPL